MLTLASMQVVDMLWKCHDWNGKEGQVLPNMSITLHPILAGSYYTCVCAMHYRLGFEASM